jgi:hypothetical protein
MSNFQPLLFIQVLLATESGTQVEATTLLDLARVVASVQHQDTEVREFFVRGWCSKFSGGRKPACLFFYEAVASSFIAPYAHMQTITVV